MQEDVFSGFGAGLTKIQQDQILCLGMHGTIHKTSVREQTYKTRELNWCYSIRIPEETAVCKQFYMSLYQVSAIFWDVDILLFPENSFY